MRRAAATLGFVLAVVGVLAIGEAQARSRDTRAQPSTIGVAVDHDAGAIAPDSLVPPAAIAIASPLPSLPRCAATATASQPWTAKSPRWLVQRVLRL